MRLLRAILFSLGMWMSFIPTVVAQPRDKPPWSFRAIARPEPPATKFAPLARNVIDHFLFRKLEEKGLQPAPEADRVALLRRVTFDLTGLPPTPAEIDAFLEDRSPIAYEKVVDRLLASPAFGERWARHWLDVVRFGESYGYEQNLIRVSAWPYRDYVIQAFNEDRPFDRFIAEQLAGDVLGGGDPRIEAATGFLVAGVHDTVVNGTEEGRRQQRTSDLDDIVSTVGATFLGLTVGCARCHDHKFDPIAQKDYYRLTAVFAGVLHGERTRGKVTLSDAERERLDELTGRRRAIHNLLAEMDVLARNRVLAAQGIKSIPRPACNSRRNIDDFVAANARFVRFTILATHDELEPCLDEIEVFGPDSPINLALASRGAAATASSLLPGYKSHRIFHLNDGVFGNESSWISNERGQGWVQIELPETTKICRVVWGRDSSEPAGFFDRVPIEYRIEVSLDGRDWRTVSTHADRAAVPEALDTNHLRRVLNAEEIERRNLLLEEYDNLSRFARVIEPPRVYIGRFATPDPIFFLKRGDVLRRGDEMQPAALSGIPDLPGQLDPAWKTSEPARRVALARWLTHPKNPLTARVIVNRLWQHHFGRGLVATPSDFGRQGSPPSHPELLDWLASELQACGWRLKRLHRLMVTSHAYRQSSNASKKDRFIDADNVWLARMPLRRIEAEVLRDSMLAVAGNLDRRMGGLGFPLFQYRTAHVAIYEPLPKQGPDTWRRSIYAFTPRAVREDLLATFDCPEPAQRTPRRDVTTTPLQALTLLNGSFTTQQAEQFAERILRGEPDDVGKQVSLAFRLAFGRAPGAEGHQAAVELVERRGLAALCRTLLNANEFIYY